MAFVTGSACLSLATFFLCVIHQARTGVFLAGGVAAIAWSTWERRSEARRKSLPAVPRPWLALFAVVFVVFSAMYLVHAVAPEVSPDGSGYHLGNVARFYRMHGFDWNHRSMYSYLSQGAEMLFLVAFCFGGHSSAALVHFAFFCALPLLTICFGRRSGFPGAGCFAGILVFVSPVVGLEGTSAYNDLALATVLFAGFYLLQVWDENRSLNLLIICGLLAGFAYGIKYTGFLAPLFAVAFVCWRGGRLREFAAVAGGVALAASPWIVRNWIWVRNPFAPFLNRWFTNPYFHPGMETSYLADLRHYEGLKHLWELPFQLTVRGGVVPGLLGPGLLLAPVALLALRKSPGRRLLLAALVFAIPAYFNTGSRFLIPSLPFLTLAMGLALSQAGAFAFVLAALAAVACWPRLVPLYCDPIAWRLRPLSLRVALRKTPENLFLSRNLADYPLRDAIERSTQPGDRIFSFAGRSEAYIARDIVVGYESALGNLAQAALWAPATDPPVSRRILRFAPVTARAIRVVNEVNRDDYWPLAEVQLQSGGRGVARAPGWRYSASHNSPEAYLAFDGNAATRWSTWQSMVAGDWLAVDFGEIASIDTVILDGPAITFQPRVERLNESGKWERIAATQEVTSAILPVDIRVQATRALKERGIGFLLINDGEFTAADMKEHSSLWGITELAEANGIHFYRID